MRNLIVLFIGICCSVFLYPDNNYAQDVHPDPIRVMTFNIRFDNPEDGVNAWPRRRPLVKDILQIENPDLIGIQEALKHQVTQIAADLPGYAWIGVGRDDGDSAGEFAAVYYRISRFNLLRADNFWLSETPQEPGSTGWDAVCVRIVTWAALEDKQTTRKLFIFNTHFDHIGNRARKESVRLLKHKVRDVAGDNAFVITGDFNLTPTTDLYKELTAGQDTSGAILMDARQCALDEPQGPNWTFHGFGRSSDRPLVDYIFVNQNFDVNRHITLHSEEINPYPSDHLPVIVDLYWSEKNR